MSHPKPLLALLLLALLLLAIAAPAALAKPAHRQGDTVPIAGQVVDKQGNPLADVMVVLEVSRSSFSLRRMQQEQGSVLRMPAKTDARGHFRFDWTWQRHYNLFQLAVGLEVTYGDRPGFEVVHRHDLSAEIAVTAPSDLKLVVAETGYLYFLRRLLAGQATAGELELYRKNGRPGRVDDYGDGKSAWWYFEAGKVYRLASGVFEQEQSFTPILPVP